MAMSASKASLLLAGLLALSTPYAQTGAGPGSASVPPVMPAEKPVAGMSGDQKEATEARIEATAKADREACASMHGNAKDVCEADAKAKEKVAKAELDYQRSGSESDRAKLAGVKAEAEYEVARQRCEDQQGDAQAACMERAKRQQQATRAGAPRAAPRN